MEELANVLLLVDTDLGTVVVDNCLKHLGGILITYLREQHVGKELLQGYNQSNTETDLLLFDRISVRRLLHLLQSAFHGRRVEAQDLLLDVGQVEDGLHQGGKVTSYNIRRQILLTISHVFESTGHILISSLLIGGERFPLFPIRLELPLLGVVVALLWLSLISSRWVLLFGLLLQLLLVV